MKLRKIFSLIYLFLFLFLVGCVVDEPTKQPNEDEKNTTTTLTIFSVNDFHGAIEENGSMIGIYKLGQYLIDEKSKSPDTTLILSAGDMFQGTAVSSMTRGKSIVDAMNIIGFDAMTLGNHEFDWGIDTILKYQDKDMNNGEANFPFLAANINDKKTNKLASWAKPYTVIYKSEIKVGIVGIIGHDQTKDILTSYVEDYEFTDELTAIKKYTKILREEEKCDVVIVSAHCDTTNISEKISELSGSEYVDAIINGHTHQNYYGDLNYGDRTAPLPYVQSGSYGKYIGKITLTIFNKTKEVIKSSCENLRTTSVCKEESSQIINKYQDYAEYFNKANEVLGVCGFDMYQPTGGQWASDVLAKVDNAVIGIVNSGGIRGNGFPIRKGETITYGDIFEIMPFENKVVLVSIKGSYIKKLADYSSLFISSNLSNYNGYVTIDGVEVRDDEYYRVATIDFLFEKNNYQFKNGKDPVSLDMLFRDLLVEDVKENCKTNGEFKYFG